MCLCSFACKAVPEMTYAQYTVSGGMLNPTSSLTHSSRPGFKLRNFVNYRRSMFNRDLMLFLCFNLTSSIQALSVVQKINKSSAYVKV